MRGLRRREGPKMRCPQCNTVLQSMHRHDLHMCPCPNGAFVDGGNDYLRYGYRETPPVPHLTEETV